jgi:hypothetical protein
MEKVACTFERPIHEHEMGVLGTDIEHEASYPWMRFAGVGVGMLQPLAEYDPWSVPPTQQVGHERKLPDELLPLDEEDDEGGGAGPDAVQLSPALLQATPEKSVVDE